MTKTQKVLTGVALATVTFIGIGGATIAVRAQEGNGPPFGPGMHGRMMGRGGVFGELRMGLRGLNLTEDQRTQVRSILQSHREDFKALLEKGRAAREQLQQAASGSPVDENAVRNASGAVGDAAADAAILRAKVRNEIFALLTPEQRQKADALKQQMQQRRREHAERVKDFVGEF